MKLQKGAGLDGTGPDGQPQGGVCRGSRSLSGVCSGPWEPGDGTPMRQEKEEEGGVSERIVWKTEYRTWNGAL